jgi:hypothetical protein
VVALASKNSKAGPPALIYRNLLASIRTRSGAEQGPRWRYSQRLRMWGKMILTNKSNGRTRSRMVYLLPSLHFCACVVIALGRLDWWQYLFLVDLPVSGIVLAIAYNHDHPFVLFGIIGTFWWYLLSRGAYFCWRTVSAAIRNRRAARPQG